MNPESVFKNRMSSKYLILSVIGSHAGEGIKEIFDRKQEEIDKTGKSFWLVQSYKARPEQVQYICKKADELGQPIYCAFINPAQAGGANPTIDSNPANYFSLDSKEWTDIPVGIKTTGKVNRNSTALVFDRLDISGADVEVDLWDYSEFGTNDPVKLILGASTICCEKKPSEGLKSRFRKIVGIGRLVPPYGVWLK